MSELSLIPGPFSLVSLARRREYRRLGNGVFSF